MKKSESENIALTKTGMLKLRIIESKQFKGKLLGDRNERIEIRTNRKSDL